MFQVQVKMSVDEFMGKFPLNKALAFNHPARDGYAPQTGMNFLSQIASEYPHLQGYAGRPPSYSFHALSDEAGDAKMQSFSVFRPDQRFYGFTPGGKPSGGRIKPI